MEEYAEDTKDLELKALIKMVEKYGSRIPKIVDSIKYNTTTDKQFASVIFSTIHKSKGQTYKIPILISEDHFDIDSFFEKRFEKKDSDLEMDKVYPEMCIIYVAITRCAGKIQLSDIIKKYLIRRYEFYKNDFIKPIK